MSLAFTVMLLMVKENKNAASVFFQAPNIIQVEGNVRSMILLQNQQLKGLSILCHRVPDKYNTTGSSWARVSSCIMEMTPSQTAGTWGTVGNTSRTHHIGRCVGKEGAPNWRLGFGRRCSPCCSLPALLTASPPGQPFQAGRGLQSFHWRKSHLERMHCCWQTWTVAGGGKMGKIRRKKPAFTNISFLPLNP